jgi:hypothetical protein
MPQNIKKDKNLYKILGSRKFPSGNCREKYYGLV